LSVELLPSQQYLHDRPCRTASDVQECLVFAANARVDVSIDSWRVAHTCTPPPPTHTHTYRHKRARIDDRPCWVQSSAFQTEVVSICGSLGLSPATEYVDPLTGYSIDIAIGLDKEAITAAKTAGQPHQATHVIRLAEVRSPPASVKTGFASQPTPDPPPNHAPGSNQASNTDRPPGVPNQVTGVTASADVVTDLGGHAGTGNSGISFSARAGRADVDPGVRFALEVDGPTHEARTTGELLGAGVMKNRHLRAAGWRVARVNYKVWRELFYGAQQRELIKRLLTEAR
jgi:hypothetical protein